MQVSLVFDDLAEFVAAYRGRISVEGMLFDSNDLHPEGTILGVHISLSDELILVKGKAGVLSARELLTSSGAIYRTLLRFVELDEDSSSLIERLVQRAEEEGTPRFSVEQAGRELNDDSANQEPPTQAIDLSTRRQSTTDVADALSSALDEGATAPPPGKPAVVPPANRARRIVMIALAVISVIVLVTAAMWFVSGLLTDSEGDQDIDPAPVATEAPPVLAEPSPTAMPVDAEQPPIPATESQTEPTLAPPTPVPTPVPARPTATTLATRITGIEWRAEGGGVIVVISADSPVATDQVHHFALEEDGERRYVLQISAIETAPKRYRTKVQQGFLAAIRSWHHTELQPPELYVVLDLALDGEVHGVNISGSTIEVQVGIMEAEE